MVDPRLGHRNPELHRTRTAPPPPEVGANGVSLTAGGGGAVRVRWEELATDGSMEAQAVGSLLVSVGPAAAEGSSQEWGLTVSREGPEPGSCLGTPLPGEDEVC